MIAILTDGHVVTEEEGRKPDSVMIKGLGWADKVIAAKDDMAIVGGHGDGEQIQPPGVPHRSGQLVPLLPKPPASSHGL